jgi:hypothetical protein
MRLQHMGTGIVMSTEVSGHRLYHLFDGRPCTMALGVRGLITGNHRESFVDLNDLDTAESIVCAPMELWAMQRIFGHLVEANAAIVPHTAHPVGDRTEQRVPETHDQSHPQSPPFEKAAGTARYWMNDCTNACKNPTHVKSEREKKLSTPRV